MPLPLFRRRNSSESSSGSRTNGIDQIRRQVDGLRRTVLYDGEVGLYQRWYFELRLKEEMDRCLRYKLSMAVLVVVVAPHLEQSEQELQRQAAATAYVTSREVRSVDLTAALGFNEYGVCLVHCDRVGAEAARKRLRSSLKDYECAVGIALFPEDNCEAKLLIELARDRANRRLFQQECATKQASSDDSTPREQDGSIVPYSQLSCLDAQADEAS